MYEMNIRNEKKHKRLGARDCAYIALFVALMLASQMVLASLPGVEIVTVLVIVFSFVFGVKRGVFAVTAFSVLRQIVFGVFFEVLVLYLLYFNLLACLFGWMGKHMPLTGKTLGWMTLISCLCTAAFTMLDNLLTPLWYGYSQKATIAYFYASFSFMIPHMVCVSVSVVILFMPLTTTLKRMDLLR